MGVAATLPELSEWTFTILSSVIDTFDFLTRVLYSMLGRALSFCKTEHCWTKKSLHRLALF